MTWIDQSEAEARRLRERTNKQSSPTETETLYLQSDIKTFLDDIFPHFQRIWQDFASRGYQVYDNGCRYVASTRIASFPVQRQNYALKQSREEYTGRGLSPKESLEVYGRYLCVKKKTPDENICLHVFIFPFSPPERDIQAAELLIQDNNGNILYTVEVGEDTNGESLQEYFRLAIENTGRTFR